MAYRYLYLSHAYWHRIYAIKEAPAVDTIIISGCLLAAHCTMSKRSQNSVPRLVAYGKIFRLKGSDDPYRHAYDPSLCVGSAVAEPMKSCVTDEYVAETFAVGLAASGAMYWCPQTGRSRRCSARAGVAPSDSAIRYS